MGHPAKVGLRTLLYIAPIRTRAAVDHNWHFQFDHRLHLMLHQLLYLLNLLPRNIEEELVVHLQRHSRLKLFFPETAVDADHGNLDQVRRGTLQRSIHRCSFRKAAQIRIAALHIGDRANPAEERVDPLFSARLFKQPIDVAAHSAVACEVCFDVEPGYVLLNAQLLRQSKGGDSVHDAEIDGLGTITRLFVHRCGRNAVGFKVNLGQNEIAFHDLLTDVNIRKIILRRRNRVKTFVSELIAEQTGQWESYEFSDFSRPSPAVEVDSNRLREYLAATDNYYRGIENLLHSTNQQVLQVAYEDLRSVREQRRILSFLGVSTSVPALIPVTRKRNQADLRSLVSNFDELRSALKNEELIAQLESPEF